MTKVMFTLLRVTIKLCIKIILYSRRNSDVIKNIYKISEIMNIKDSIYETSIEEILKNQNVQLVWYNVIIFSFIFFCS